MKSSFLRERNGKLSFSRIVGLMWNVLVALAWAGICVWKRDLIDIPPGVVTIVSATLAAIVGHRFAERKDAPQRPGAPGEEVAPPPQQHMQL